MKKILVALVASALTLGGCAADPAGDAATRQQIRITGSSTVYPFTTAVAERFAQSNPSFNSPVVESNGTGAGIQLFCAGIGAAHPDIVNASRQMKASEYRNCQENGVRSIIEVPVGIDGLVLIESAEQPANFSLTARDIYAALAARPFGQEQRARNWSDVNSTLPNVPIRVFGPGPTSGSRDSFAELILERGCKSDNAMVRLETSNRDQYRQVCTQIREDGAFVESGENDNLLMQQVSQNRGTIGVLGYNFLEENAQRVRGIPIGGVAPGLEEIRGYRYPASRQLYIYVKGEHLNAVPGLRQFLQEYARAWAPGGYLAERGLIPSPDPVRQRATQTIERGNPMNGRDLPS